MAVSANDQTDIAAALVRLYVFLAQYLDRCSTKPRERAFRMLNCKAHLNDDTPTAHGDPVGQSCCEEKAYRGM